MTPIKTNSPKLHREARLAREKLHLEGEVPDGAVSYTHLTLPTNREV